MLREYVSAKGTQRGCVDNREVPVSTELLYQCASCLGLTSEWSSHCVICGSGRGLRLLNGRLGRRRAAPDAAAALAIGGESGEDAGYRIHTGIPSLDRVLGKNRRDPDVPASYGLHIPSVVLVAGAPGTGKTTLLLQAFAEMGSREKRLLISSEQTRSEIAGNIADLGLRDRLVDLPVLAT